MADDPLAFDTEKCPIDPVVALPQCYRFIVDPRVDPPPDDMPECPAEELVVDPEPPCPTIGPDFPASESRGESEGADGSVNYGGLYKDNPPAMRFGFTKGNCCDFDLNIELDIPCPRILPEEEDPDQKVPPFVETPNRLEYKFEMTDPEKCEFTLDIDLDIHCPEITPQDDNPDVKTPTFVDTANALTYAFTKVEESCDYDLDIEIDIHCPLFLPSTPTEVVFADGDATLTYYCARDGSSCDFELFIDVETVEGFGCPDMVPIVEEFVYLYTAGGVQGYVSWVFAKNPASCEWTLTIDALVACVSMAPTSATYVYGYVGYAGVQTYFGYYFSKTADCDWTLNVEFVVACVSMLPVTAQFVYGYVGYGGVQSYISWYFTIGSGCTWTLTMDFVCACPDIRPTSIQYVYLYTAQGVQGYISWYFIRSVIACSYELVIDALVPCPYIRPQAPTFAYGSYVTGGQSFIQYYFIKSATECQYTLAIEFQLQCPLVTHTFNYGLHKIACSKAGSMSFAVHINPLNCLDWSWYLHLWVPGGCGPQLPCDPCAETPGDGELPQMRMAPGGTIEMNAPIAAVPSDGPDHITYAAAVPLYMPDNRIEDVMVVAGPWEPGEHGVARTKLDEGFLSMVAPETLEVVGLVPDRPAVTGAWVDGTDVVVAVSPTAAAVGKVVLRVSGRNRNKTGRYATLTDKQLLAIELAEAVKAEEPY